MKKSFAVALMLGTSFFALEGKAVGPTAQEIAGKSNIQQLGRSVAQINEKRSAAGLALYTTVAECLLDLQSQVASAGGLPATAKDEITALFLGKNPSSGSDVAAEAALIAAVDAFTDALPGAPLRTAASSDSAAAISALSAAITGSTSSLQLILKQSLEATDWASDFVHMFLDSTAIAPINASAILTAQMQRLWLALDSLHITATPSPIPSFSLDGGTTRALFASSKRGAPARTVAEIINFAKPASSPTTLLHMLRTLQAIDSASGLTLTVAAPKSTALTLPASSGTVREALATLLGTKPNDLTPAQPAHRAAVTAITGLTHTPKTGPTQAWAAASFDQYTIEGLVVALEGIASDVGGTLA